MSDYIKAASAALMDARQTLTGLSEYPMRVPADLKTAYAIQEHSIANWPDEVVGWKVGGMPANLVDVHKAKRLAGPIFKKTVKTCDDGATLDMGSYPNGFVAVEAEYIVFLKNVSRIEGRDIALDDMAQIVEAVHVGVEIASSPIQNINSFGPLVVVSDFGNNAGLVIGPKVEDPLGTNYSDHMVSVDFDGVQIGAKPTGTGEAGPFGAVVFLVNHLRALGYDIPDGTAVSTGAITGVHDAEIGVKSKVEFEGLGTMFINLVPFEK